MKAAERRMVVIALALVHQASYLTANPNLITTTKMMNPLAPATIRLGLRPVNALNACIPVTAAYRACDANEESASDARSKKVDQVDMIEMIISFLAVRNTAKEGRDRSQFGPVTRGGCRYREATNV
jgi:hypothetical protein